MARLLLLVCFPVLAIGCSDWGLGICDAADKICHELDGLVPKVREASEQVLDHLFKDDLPPAIDKLVAASESLMDRAETDYEKAVNATIAEFEQLAEKVKSLATEFAKDVTKDVEEIVKLVSKEVLQDTQKIIADVDTRVNALLTRLENDGKELFCAAGAFLDNFEKQLASYFEKQDCDCVQAMLAALPGLKQDCECTSCFRVGGWYPKCPCNPWGIHFGPGWYNRGKYLSLKCHLNKTIDYEHWTVDQIVEQLSIMQGAALSFRCLEDLNPGITENRNYFSDEYTSLTHSILTWTRPNRKQSTKHVAREALGRVQGNPCAGKTLEGCLEQSMNDLSSAKADLSSAKEDFDSAKQKFENKYLGEVKVFNADSCPTGWKEVDAMKGYVLVSRPDGGQAGKVIGTALQNNEKSRVAAHDHPVDITDNGHSHSIDDPGHSHSYSYGGGNDGDSGPKDGWPGEDFSYDADTDDETTGITIESTQSNIDVKVKASTSEGNPFAYVLLCQHVAPAELLYV